MKMTFWILILSLTVLSAPMAFSETAPLTAGEETKEAEPAAAEERWWDDLEEGEEEAETEGFGDKTALDEDSPLRPVKAEEAVPATAKK